MFYPKQRHGQIPASLVLMSLHESAASSPLNVGNISVCIYELRFQISNRNFGCAEVFLNFSNPPIKHRGINGY
jgi:hypothetical protein